MQHNFSGYPGAICLDCFVDDQNELCLADHDVALYCIYDHAMCEEGHPHKVCTVHVNQDCPGKRSLLDSVSMCRGMGKDFNES